MTAAEHERLRVISYQRQTDAGFKALKNASPDSIDGEDWQLGNYNMLAQNETERALISNSQHQC